MVARPCTSCDSDVCSRLSAVLLFFGLPMTGLCSITDSRNQRCERRLGVRSGRSVPFGLIRCTVQLCRSAAGGDRPSLDIRYSRKPAVSTSALQVGPAVQAKCSPNRRAVACIRQDNCSSRALAPLSLQAVTGILCRVPRKLRCTCLGCLG